ncbi:Clr6 histone deacetylase associated PHD protein-2 Cph2 [Madurella fahalii]|uniref:Clr6 histone deacetylase associated PHD protein-2 Cph2 n=1 Tax=Madurella fahalii TaxID=1157608 RepID=A0ABQ0GEB7_9PEZI
MADQDPDSPSLFDGLDTFELGDDRLGDSGLADDLADSGLGTSAPNAAAAAVTSPSVGENVPTTTGPNGSGPASIPQSAVTAPQQPDFFNPVSSNWVFQNTPPYDSPIGENPFGAVPQQSWELPVHTNLNQTLLQQQSLYLPSPATPALDPNLGSAATTAANAPIVPTFAPNAEAFRTENQRNIQNTLTPAQRERLKTIAMPPHLQYHSPKSAGSPDSNSSHDKGAVSSPDAAGPSKPNSRKRKSSAEVDEDDDDDELDGQQPVKKTAHNMIEKRYRTNLNDKIAALRDSVPSLRIMSKSARGEDTTEDREELHGLTPAHKLNKATVLSKATEYIRHLEKRNNRLIEENNSMQARIAAFEKLFMAGAITGQLPNPLQQPPTPIQYPQDPAFMNTPMAAPRGPDPPGMIPIPDDMKRILTSQQMNAGRPYPVPAQHFGQNPAMLRQQQIQQQQQQQQAQASRWNPYFGKLMVGSLAGLMLVEALVENEQGTETTEGRGLFGLPVHLLAAFVRSTHFSIGGYHISAIGMIAKLRLLSLVGFFLWAACSSFIDTPIFQSSKHPKHKAAVVQAVPSLASPIHVRRQAWLTAIQTVWVPRHNFFLEAAALLLKTAKYTLRNVVGPHSYLALTGLSEEEEAARVKAWSIALDAQLAGGDMEINKSRLTLTLIASGTLPDTPLRLMMKALHIRVLLWQLNGASWATNLIAAKLARSRWDEARQLNHILNSLQGEQTSDEALPEHLAVLLEQDCDEVLNDGIIQRAHNLAWNQHTTYNLIDKVDGMDPVVEDAAVRSPMDAVAAWYSSITLHRVLVDSFSNHRDDSMAAAIADDIALAVKVAPIGSNAQVRALVARAVLVDGKRGANIVAAMQALGPSLNPDKHPQYSRGVPPLIDSPMSSIAPDPDAQMALRCAMGIAQLQKFAYLPHPAVMVIDSILPSRADIEDMSLLGYAAAFCLMERLYRHAVGRETCSRSLERLAGSLRIWIGSSAGDKAGVDEMMRRGMIERCLAVTKSVVGMEADPGYVSMDECEVGEDGEGGC